MWRRLLLLIILLAILMSPASVMADTSVGITIIASGFVCAVPGNFTLTYVSDYEVGISWVKGLGAQNTMVRAAVGRLPENRTDGYLVYYGNGTSATDTGVSLDETAAQVYYRAWSQNAGGGWEEVGASAFIAGPGMTLIALAVLGLGLTALAYFLRKVVIAFAAGAGWVVFTGYAYITSSATYDVYWFLFIFGCLMVLICGLEPLFMHERKPKGEEAAEDLDTEWGEMDEEMDREERRFRGYERRK